MGKGEHHFLFRAFGNPDFVLFDGVLFSHEGVHKARDVLVQDAADSATRVIGIRQDDDVFPFHGFFQVFYCFTWNVRAIRRDELRI